MKGLFKFFGQIINVKLKSITDPLFRYGICILILAVITAIFKTETWIIIILFIFGFGFMVIGLIFYCYFAINNPDYLRSEEFQITKQSIEIIGDKDNQLNPQIDKITKIVSPYSKDINGDKKNKIG